MIGAGAAAGIRARPQMRSAISRSCESLFGMATRLASVLVIGVGTFVLSGIAFVATLAVCRGENVGSSAACRPVDHHPDATFWLAVVLPAIVTTVVLAFRCPTGRWAWARFAPMAAWGIYLVVVIVTSPHG